MKEMEKLAKPEKCSEMMHDGLSLGHGRRCTTDAKGLRDGKPYCTIHDPEYIKEKSRKWEEKYNRKLEERKVNRKKCDELNARKDILIKMSEGIPTKDLPLYEMGLKGTT